MKKTVAMTALTLVIVFGAAPEVPAAQSGGGFQQPPTAASGGFSGPGPSITTAREAMSMRDDALVVLRGSVVQHLGKDRYIFRDATGSITVEIDDNEWSGQTITPGDTVELHGEVDKDWNSVEIDVDRVVKVQ